MTPQVKAGLIVGRRDYHRHGAVGGFTSAHFRRVLGPTKTSTQRRLCFDALGERLQRTRI